MRGSLYLRLGWMVVCLLMALVAQGQLAKTPWPKFQANILSNGRGVGRNAVGTLLWKSLALADSTPVIGIDGTIYSGSGSDFKFNALDPLTGNVRWSYQLVLPVEASAAIGANGLIYFHCNDGFLYALDAATGAFRWKMDTTGGNETYNTPTIGSDGTVYFSGYNYVFAFDGNTGAIKWQVYLGSVGYSSPSIGTDGTIYVGTGKAQFYALNPADGSEKWHINTTAAMVVAAPTIGDDNNLYAWSSDRNLYAISPEGQVLWITNFPNGGFGAPAMGKNGYLYVQSINDQGKTVLVAISNQSGSIIWSAEGQSPSPYLTNSPAIGSDGTVYVPPDDGSIRAYNGTTGKLLWTYPTPSGIGSFAIDTDGTLYTTSGGHAIALQSIHVISITIQPSAVEGGVVATGTLTTNAPAPVGGAPIGLVCDNPNATIPPVVTIPAGQTTATFSITTSPVNSVNHAVITATPGVDQHASLTINPPSLISLTLDPSNVSGGNNSTGTLTISSPAATGGLAISLSSDSKSAVVPQTISVPAGQLTVTFTVKTSGVDSLTTANISAKLFTVTQSVPLTIQPATLSSISVNPMSVLGGSPSTGTATLSGIAGPGGAIVSLSSSDPSATVPASVIVASGKTSATFTISTTGVNKTVAAVITGTLGADPQTATLTVNPATLATLVVNPTSVLGGSTSTGTITLTGPAGPGGTVVTLSTDHLETSVPSSITIPSGAKTATFNVTTQGVNTLIQSVMTATLNSGTLSATLTVQPAVLQSFSLNPIALVGGNPSTGTVTLSGPAAASGTSITLSSGNSAATVPPTFIIPSGATSGTFTISTSAVSTPITSVITATLNSVSLTATLTVNPAKLISVSLTPSEVVGGKPTTGTVSLSDPAGPTGLTISLKSSTSDVTVPTSVTVPPGKTSAPFAVSTAGVLANESATLTATLNGTSATASLSVLAPSLLALNLNSATVQGGSTSTGTVVLSGPAGSNGLAVSLTSSVGSATVPPTVVIAAGQTSASFTIATVPVKVQTTATISAIFNGATSSASLTINPVMVSSLTVNPTSVAGSASVVGTITLNGPAYSGGAIVSISATSSAASMPSSITIPAGQSSANFGIQASNVSTTIIDVITASLNGSSQTSNLTLQPLGVTSLTFDPSAVNGGTSSIGTVHLDGIAPKGGMLIKLVSNNTAAHVPASITILAGASSGKFTASTTAVPVQRVVTVSASFGGKSVSGNLTVNPPTLLSFTVNPTSLLGGKVANGTITISSAAPTGGFVVNLASTDPAAIVPTTVSIPAGRTTSTFIVKTLAVATQRVATLKASSGNSSVTASLTILPPQLVTLTLSPSSVTGGKNSTGTVTLNGPAPTGGLSISIASSNPSASVPSTLSILAGKTAGSFTVKTVKVNAKTTLTVSANFGGVTKTASLTISK